LSLQAEIPQCGIALEALGAGGRAGTRSGVFFGKQDLDCLWSKIVEEDGLGLLDDAELGGRGVEPPQAGEAVDVKAVLDVFVQIGAAGGGEGLIVGLVGASNVVECSDAVPA